MSKALNKYLLWVILILGAQYSMAFRNHNLLEDSLIDSIESLEDPNPSTFINLNDTSANDQYFCPPCGCTGDHLILDSPGKCTYCSMHLIKLGSGIKKDAQLMAAPLFQNAGIYAKYYLRIIYPLIVFELLFAIFLFTKVGKSQRLLFFSLFVLSLSLYMLKFQLYGTVYAITRSAITLFAPISFLLWVWPSLYFFLKQSEMKKEFEFKKVYVHFIPGVIFFIAQLIMFFTYPGSLALLYNQFDSYLIPVEQVLFVVGGFYYGWKIMLLKTSLSTTRENKATNRKLLVFILFTFFASASLSMILILNFSLYRGLVTTLDYHLLWFLFALFIPWFCYEVWNNKEDFMMIKIPNYRLQVDRINQLKQEFDNILNNGGIYENQKFGLTEASKLLEISLREMTEFIRRAYQANFYEVINSYRVEAAKKKLLSPEHEHLTNEAIGQLCGFGSKTTFIKSFKMITGLTPGEFKRSNSV